MHWGQDIGLFVDRGYFIAFEVQNLQRCTMPQNDEVGQSGEFIVIQFQRLQRLDGQRTIEDFQVVRRGAENSYVFEHSNTSQLVVENASVELRSLFDNVAYLVPTQKDIIHVQLHNRYDY